MRNKLGGYLELDLRAEIIDTNNAIVMVDPINTPGTWHNNENFQMSCCPCLR